MARFEPRPAPLPDEEARRAIREDLGVSLLVEAAAGTGKTTSLIERMTALIRTGATTVDRLSAVTFTIKAAAELSERFQTSLEAAARSASGEEKERLEAALARLDSAFVGTIHAFCARLLRERPVEAGVDPGFSEMDEPENAAARLEAWERYTERLFTDESPILPRLAALNVRLDDLRQTYETLSDNEDVAPMIGLEERPPDFTRERAAVQTFLERAAAELPAEMPAGGWTEYQEAVRRAARLLALRDAGDASAFAAVLDAICRVKKATDAGRRGSSTKRFAATWSSPRSPAGGVICTRFSCGPSRPLRRSSRTGAAATAGSISRISCSSPAICCAATRVSGGVPGTVPAHSRRRVPGHRPDSGRDPLLPDGRGPGGEGLAEAHAEPGSLFVVGDPKQSIYRFRRADIETYGAVRDRLEKSGRVLT